MHQDKLHQEKLSMQVLVFLLVGILQHHTVTVDLLCLLMITMMSHLNAAYDLLLVIETRTLVGGENKARFR